MDGVSRGLAPDDASEPAGEALEHAAEQLLAAIERQVAFMAEQSARVVQAFFGGAPLDDLMLAPPAALSPGQDEATITAEHIEQYAPRWARLVPPDPRLRAQLALVLGQKYAITAETAPGLWEAIGVESPGRSSKSQQVPGVATSDQLQSGSGRRAGDTVAADRPVEADLAWVTLRRGEELFHQGALGDAVYIVVSGRLRVLIEERDWRRLVEEVGRGELVGEMAIISGQPRAATVEAVRDSELLRMSKESFDRRLRRSPEATMNVVRLLISRLQRRAAGVQPRRYVTIAVVPGSAGAPISKFAARLAEALRARQPTTHLSSARVDAELGASLSQTPAEGVEHERLLTWLSERERLARYVVYESDAGPTEWTRRCLRQADRVLVVAESTRSPLDDPLGRLFADLEAERLAEARELVLIHPPGTVVPSGTARWLAGRAIVRHHHLRGGAADFERLVRRITGQAVGLALSGGGTRGYAHIGVIRALEEAGVAVDFVGGASAGAEVAALLAFGLRPAEIAARMQAYRSSLADFTVPLSALTTGYSLYRWLLGTFGELQIEDLPLPLACVTTNLTDGALGVHQRGCVARAVLASNSVPGLSPPVEIDGRLHVDGGLLDNTPLDVLQTAVEGGPVVAVDVVPQTALRAEAPLEPGLPGWRLLAQQANPFGRSPALPSIAGILERVVEVAGAYQQRGVQVRDVDLYLRPPLSAFSFLDRRIPEIIDLGYRHAAERIPDWLRQCEASGDIGS